MTGVGLGAAARTPSQAPARESPIGASPLGVLGAADEPGSFGRLRGSAAVRGVRVTPGEVAVGGGEAMRGGEGEAAPVRVGVRVTSGEVVADAYGSGVPAGGDNRQDPAIPFGLAGSGSSGGDFFGGGPSTLRIGSLARSNFGILTSWGSRAGSMRAFGLLIETAASCGLLEEPQPYISLGFWVHENNRQFFLKKMTFYRPFCSQS
jgi:hypothetical protein